MEPTTTGRFRVLDRRPDGTILLLDLDAASDAVAAPDTASEADLRPLAVRPAVADSEADGHDSEGDGHDSDDVDADDTAELTLADRVAALEPGYVIEASLQWDDSEARFVDCAITNRTRIQYADGVTGIFEKARETWHDARVAGAAMNSAVTYSTGKTPNGVVYTFAKQRPPRDLFEEFRTGATPIEPLIQRVDAEHERPTDSDADDDADPNDSDDDGPDNVDDDATVDVDSDDREVNVAPDADVDDVGPDADVDDIDPDDPEDGEPDERAIFVLNPADEEFVVLYIVFDRDGMLAKTVRDTYGLPAV